jgi:hypothetical protein
VTKLAYCPWLKHEKYHLAKILVFAVPTPDYLSTYLNTIDGLSGF